MRTRSLRTRLVAATLLLLALASAVIAVVTTIVLRQYLVRQLDDGLRVASRVIIRNDGGPSSADALLRGPPRPPDSLTAVIRNGAVVDAQIYPRTGGTVPVPAAEYADLTALVPNGRAVSADLGTLGEYRLIAATTPRGDVVVSGQSEQQRPGHRHEPRHHRADRRRGPCSWLRASRAPSSCAGSCVPWNGWPPPPRA